MIRPTPRVAIILAIGLPPVLALLLFDGSLWPTAAIAVLAVLLLTVIDAARIAPEQAAIVGFTAPDTIYVGTEDFLRVELFVARGVARDPTTVCETTAPIAPVNERELQGGPNRFQTALSLTADRRGEGAVERIWLRWRGPMALTERHVVLSPHQSIRVIPNLRSLREGAIRFRSTDSWFGRKATALQGDGSDFDSLRDYLPGLDPRSIDWKHSARHRALVCKEFRAEQNHNIVVAFDTGHLMSEPLDRLSRLDHAINAGLLLGYMAWRSGDRIGLYAFDSDARDYAEPTGGARAFMRLQQSAASLKYRSEETNFTLGLAVLQSRLPRRSLVVLLTEFVDTVTAELMIENVSKLSNRHLVVFVVLRDATLDQFFDVEPNALADVARAVIAAEANRERAVVLERLRRRGVLVIETSPDRLGPALLDRYLEIKRQELI